MKPCLILCIRQDATHFPDSVREQLAAKLGISADQIELKRTDPTTPQEALDDFFAGQQEYEVVMNFLRPNPLPSLLLEHNAQIVFLDGGGQLMDLEGLEVRARPYFADDQAIAGPGETIDSR